MSQTPDEAMAIFVGGRVQRLQNGVTATAVDTPWPDARAALARLRRADPSAVGNDPAVWAITLGDLPDQLQGRGEEPSARERAVHAALTLYARHQQSLLRPMHVRGVSLGRAAGTLARVRGADATLDSAILRRFHVVATASSFGQSLYHLRTFVALLRSEQIGLDYTVLASDLYRLQSSARAPGVRLKWGRDLHRKPSRPDDTSSSSTATSALSTGDE